MPVLKFETRVINGKPIISFDTENTKIVQEKKNYKIKNQKYPLRNNQVIDPIHKETNINSSHQKSYENELFGKKKPSEAPNKAMRVSDRNTTPDPYGKQKPYSSTHSNIRKHVKPTKDKESLFNFLDNNEKTEKPDKIEIKFPDENSVFGNRRSRKEPLTESDIDEIMKQVIVENKHLLTEEQLVDLLAKLYLDSRVNRNRQPSHKEAQESIDRSPKETIASPSIREGEKPKIQVNSSEMSQHSTKYMGISPIEAPLTAVQKKQMQWERERRELAEISSYNPWGKPGCGAPTKSVLDATKTTSEGYSQREFPTVQRDRQGDNGIHNDWPPQDGGANQLSEHRKRQQQWLRELDEQRAQQERAKLANNNERDFYQHSVQGTTTMDGGSSPGHGRGRGLADLSQISNEEMLQKRTKQLEQQESIRRQIEEKELQKRMERERKAYLDQQEDERIAREKRQFDTQYLSETARIKQKDAESGRRLAEQRNQLEAAEKSALLDKKLKRLQRLELAGHDTRQLRAGLLAEQLSGRLMTDSVDLRSDDNSYSKLHPDRGLLLEQSHQLNNRSPGGGYVRYPSTEDHAAQTDNYISGGRESRRRESDDYDRYAHQKNQRIQTVEIPKSGKYKSATSYNNRQKMENNSARKRSSSAASVKLQLSRKPKKPEPIGSRKPWGAKRVSKQYVPQSKRDPFYSTFQETRENHKQDRVNKILAQVKANMDRIPDRDANDGRLSERHKRCDTQRRYDHDKENYELNHDTYDLKNNSNAFMVEDDDDRVHASVIYKDSYKNPKRLNQTYKQEEQSLETRRTAKSPNEWWDDSNHEIVRTTDILNPAMADQRLPLSRENTGREKARQGYYKSLNPAQYGEPLNLHQDNLCSHSKQPDKREQFYQPQSHPTQRQNTILKQLSEFREGLLMKQKEIETSLSMNDDF